MLQARGEHTVDTHAAFAGKMHEPYLPQASRNRHLKEASAEAEGDVAVT